MIKERYRYCVGSGTLTIFDIDDTLFRTSAKVRVMKQGVLVRVLHNQEYNTYRLKEEETFDFKEFGDAALFRATSVPIERMVERARKIVKAHGNPHSRAIIVTARGDFDNPEEFLHTFRDHGINIDEMHVERAGNLDRSLTVSEKKKVVFQKYLNTRRYTKVRLYDDSKDNLIGFLELQSEYPDIEFEAYFVKADGNIKVMK